ncbi:hypothetical protein GMST_25630 [Geomonas silvestris]|uniref:Fibronectin type-III domain-containing protein n=1 Tax=Geomonas silvestris TaxID=2740184 RepID=A0A6V8MJS9_9BACT|nr:fibronectin type III domain-containing protein [Geomonas silvestris]GFO60238.1 hypothetical protein GMST_25630 [Geomonas silvestris]
MEERYFGQIDVTSLKGIPVNDLIVLLGTMGSHIKAHEMYQEPFIEGVLNGDGFIDLSWKLQQAQDDAATKDTGKRAYLEQFIQECIVNIRIFVNYAEIRAARHKDQRYLEGLGLKKKEKKKNSRSSYGPLGATERFVVKHGPVSGSLIFQIAKVLAAVHYDLEMCFGDPNNEADWHAAGTFLNTRNVRLDGLEPGKVYYFRVRVFGPGGFGPWSNVIKIMAV